MSNTCNMNRSLVIRNELRECCDEIRILQGLIEDAKRRYWEIRSKHSRLSWSQWIWYQLGWY